MFFKTLLLGVLIPILSAGAYPPRPFRSHWKWDTDKLEILTDMVETLLKRTGSDLRLIASQNLHNADGSFKEIKTIELTIPRRFEWGQRFRNERWDYLDELKQTHDDFGDILNGVQEDFQNIFKHHKYENQAAYQRLSKRGNVDFELYINKDEAFLQEEDGMGYYIRDNIRGNNKKQLEEQFEKRLENRNNSTLLSVLVWDADNKFVTDESTVETKLLTYVDKASQNADEKMLNFALESLSKIALNSPDRVAKELSAAMSSSFSEYNWFVTRWHEDNADNAKHDVYIRLTYDNVRVGEDILAYTIYGMKK